MNNVIEIRNLKKYFPIHKGFWQKTTSWVRAVDDVSFEVKKGETLGIVGESGCGKTTLVRVALRLHSSTSGKVRFNGRNILDMKGEGLREFRRSVQIVFQDPYWSLNPRMLIKDVVCEPLKVHRKMKKKQQLVKKARELLEIVGLNPEHINRYPHEFSGGQRQRIAIARALALDPKVLVLDEPTSAIDTLSQAQIINLLKRLQKMMGLTYLIISHDLSVIQYMADRMVVMYLGKIMEVGSTDDIFYKPAHPYTKALISAIPAIDTVKGRKVIVLEGNIPSAINPPLGCRFHTRCVEARKECVLSEPELIVDSEGRGIACPYN